MHFDKIQVPTNGTKILFEAGKWIVPDNPIIPFIEGDGIGSDITKAMIRVVDAAVKKTSKGTRKISWMEIFAGARAREKYGEFLPSDTILAIQTFLVAIKGPLTTPVGGGFRSLNVTLRQNLNLWANIRPYRDYGGPSPLKHPEDLDIVLFRENTEDVYAGVEWPVHSAETGKIRQFLNKNFHLSISPDTGIGIKLISEHASKAIVRAAIKFAIQEKRKIVTLMHKGNIEKYTEGAFNTWGYEVAKKEFGDITVTTEELQSSYGGKLPDGKILINDKIADAVFQETLINHKNFSVIVTMNLNGDYVSDAIAAQVGGLGIAPGANVGDVTGIFEATHGTAPTLANKNKANPSALILSAAMMLEYIGWKEAAETIRLAIKTTIGQKRVTEDFAIQMIGDVNSLGTAEFANAIIENIEAK